MTPAPPLAKVTSSTTDKMRMTLRSSATLVTMFRIRMGLHRIRKVSPSRSKWNTTRAISTSDQFFRPQTCWLLRQNLPMPLALSLTASHRRACLSAPRYQRPLLPQP
jgi:hypothetical protein